MAPAPHELAAVHAAAASPTTAGCFIDATTGRVLPCVALREVVSCSPTDFIDPVSGRVLPCVALMEVPIPGAGACSCGSPQSPVSFDYPLPLLVPLQRARSRAFKRPQIRLGQMGISLRHPRLCRPSPASVLRSVCLGKIGL
jgi:hypothetical protein